MQEGIKHWRRLLFARVTGFALCSTAIVMGQEVRSAIPTLELCRVLPVEGVRDPSGLTIDGNVLYSISDKVDHTIFRLELRRGAAWFRPHVSFRSGLPPPLDLEGITLTENGDFVLLSETHAELLAVSPSGQCRTLMSLRRHGQAGGLFGQPGAGPEALACFSPGRLLVAAERQPSALIDIIAGKMHTTWLDEISPQPSLSWRPPDLTGLFVDRGELWCLGRNAECVFRLQMDDSGEWQTRDVFSYANSTHRPELAYQDMQFGHAEGLAMDDQHFYVLLDNNHTPRRIRPHDRRPLLLIFARPDATRRLHP